MLLRKYISAHPRSHWSKTKCNVHVKALPQRFAHNCNPNISQKHIHVYRMEGNMLPHYWRWINGLMSHILYIPCNNTKWISGGFLFYNHLKMQKVRDYIFWHIIYACKEPTLLGSIMWKHLEQTGASLFSKSSTSLDSRDSYNYHRNYCFVTIM